MHLANSKRHECNTHWLIFLVCTASNCPKTGKNGCGNLQDMLGEFRHNLVMRADALSSARTTQGAEQLRRRSMDILVIGLTT